MLAQARMKYDNLGPVAKPIVKWTGIIGLGVTAWRMAMAWLGSDSASPWDVIGAIFDLISMPFRWPLSIIGDGLGKLGFTTFEKVTDQLIGDWDGDKKREGIGGEVVGFLDKVIGG